VIDSSHAGLLEDASPADAFGDAVEQVTDAVRTDTGVASR
jgi:hypothetical protein